MIIVKQGLKLSLLEQLARQYKATNKRTSYKGLAMVRGILWAVMNDEEITRPQDHNSKRLYNKHLVRLQAQGLITKDLKKSEYLSQLVIDSQD